VKNQEPFNPLEKRNLAESIAEKILESELHQLPPDAQFRGAGIYAIYYRGPFAPYRLLAKQNETGMSWPIYVGRAVPRGARKGLESTTKAPVLFKRLTEHAESIRQAGNLVADDFASRYLVVDDIWIPLGESLLIERFHPVWNQCLDGFGNHPPGSGRGNQKCSPWDTLHPGRAWAASLPVCASTAEELAQKVEAHLESTCSVSQNP